MTGIIKKTFSAGLMIACTGVLLPAGAIAEENAVSGSIPSSIFDTDNDGSISKEEFNSVFSEFDKNADGKLNRDEIRAGRRAMMDKRYEMLMQKRKEMMAKRDEMLMQKRMEMMSARMAGMRPSFSDCDLNGDGKIPEEEFNQAREKRMTMMKKHGHPMKHMAEKPSFSDIDTNGDGAIDGEEFKKHQSERFEKMRKHREMMWEKRRGARQNQGQRGHMPGPMSGSRPFFSDFDVDGDGKVTEKEFNESRAKRIEEKKQQGYPMKHLKDAPAFGEVDADSDGAISEDEFYDMQSRRRQQMMEKRREMFMQERREMRRSMGPGRGMPPYSKYEVDGKTYEMKRDN